MPNSLPMSSSSPGQLTPSGNFLTNARPREHYGRQRINGARLLPLLSHVVYPSVTPVPRLCSPSSPSPSAASTSPRSPSPPEPLPLPSGALLDPHGRRASRRSPAKFVAAGSPPSILPPPVGLHHSGEPPCPLSLSPEPLWSPSPILAAAVCSSCHCVVPRPHPSPALPLPWDGGGAPP